MLAPTPEQLIRNLMPWLDDSCFPGSVDASLSLETAQPSNVSTRGRDLSRSGAVRRPRSPSLSEFWTMNPLRYDFFCKHFYQFTAALAGRPRISLAPTEILMFPRGTYSLSVSGLKRWNQKAWDLILPFDSIDLMTSFPLRNSPVYFDIINGPDTLTFSPM